MPRQHGRFFGPELLKALGLGDLKYVYEITLKCDVTAVPTVEVKFYADSDQNETLAAHCRRYELHEINPLTGEVY